MLTDLQIALLEWLDMTLGAQLTPGLNYPSEILLSFQSKTWQQLFVRLIAELLNQVSAEFPFLISIQVEQHQLILKVEAGYCLPSHVSAGYIHNYFRSLLARPKMPGLTGVAPNPNPLIIDAEQLSREMLVEKQMAQFARRDKSRILDRRTLFGQPKPEPRQPGADGSLPDRFSRYFGV